MALYVDLSAPQPHPNPPPTTPETPPRETPNRSHPFSALLAVYPFLSTLARYLDHNDLYNLSSACWQFHTNLSAYRKTLLSLSLRCSNDIPTATEPTADVDFDWRRVRGGRRCARDLVKGCLRCNTPFCRNCIHKPHVAQIHSRHRRLCNTCRSSQTLLAASQKRCFCIDGGWLCTVCAPVVTRQDDASRMWSTKYARDYIVAGHGFIGCARGVKGCEGPIKEGRADGGGKGGGGAPVEWGVEMADNRWALVDEWVGHARSWCGWCNGVILSKQDDRILEQSG